MLRDFIDILIYKNRGTTSEINNITSIVQPVFKQILPYISNKKINISPRNLLSARGYVKPGVGCAKKKKKKDYITVK